MTKREKIKYLLVPAIGFGIGGALLALSDILESVEVIGIKLIIVVLIASFFLVLFLKDIKIFKKVLIILGGALVWIVVFCLWGLWFFLFGLPDFVPSSALFLGSLSIFLIAGATVGLFYALVLKLALRSKIWPVFWRGVVGLGLAFTIVLIGSGLFNQGLLVETIFFIFTGIILGLFLGWGLYRGQKLKKIGGRKKKKSPEHEKTLI